MPQYVNEKNSQLVRQNSAELPHRVRPTRPTLRSASSEELLDLLRPFLSRHLADPLASFFGGHGSGFLRDRLRGGGKRFPNGHEAFADDARAFVLVAVAPGVLVENVPQCTCAIYSVSGIQTMTCVILSVSKSYPSRLLTI